MSSTSSPCQWSLPITAVFLRGCGHTSAMTTPPGDGVAALRRGMWATSRVGGHASICPGARHCALPNEGPDDIPTSINTDLWSLILQLQLNFSSSSKPLEFFVPLPLRIVMKNKLLKLPLTISLKTKSLGAKFVLFFDLA